MSPTDNIPLTGQTVLMLAKAVYQQRDNLLLAVRLATTYCEQLDDVKVATNLLSALADACARNEALEAALQAIAAEFPTYHPPYAM